MHGMLGGALFALAADVEFMVPVVFSLSRS
jgi:hypothetical protein